MQQAEELVRARQLPYPGIPGGVFDAIGKPRQQEEYDQGWIGRVACDADVCSEMAEGSEEGNAALAEMVMDPVVEQGGSGVSTEWGEKD